MTNNIQQQSRSSKLELITSIDQPKTIRSSDNIWLDKNGRSSKCSLISVMFSITETLLWSMINLKRKSWEFGKKTNSTGSLVLTSKTKILMSKENSTGIMIQSSRIQREDIFHIARQSFHGMLIIKCTQPIFHASKSNKLKKITWYLCASWTTATKSKRSLI